MWGIVCWYEQGDGSMEGHISVRSCYTNSQLAEMTKNVQKLWKVVDSKIFKEF